MPQPDRFARPALLASVAFLALVLPLNAQEVTLTLEGDDATLRRVLEGNSLTLALEEQEDSGPIDYVAAARADYRRLLTGLYAQGFYGGTVSIRVDGREASTIAPLDAPAQVGRVDIAVTPGPVFTFGTISIGPIAPETDLPEELAPGETAASGVIRQAVADSVTGWRAVGHALAEPGAQDIRAIHAQSRLDVAVAINPGPRLTFGPLTVSGNERVRTERIIEIAGLPEGEVFDPVELERAQTRLRRTGAFASVALIEGDAPGPDATLPITAQVGEMPPRRLGFGAEIATTEGLSLTAFWMHRNLLGGAERFRVDAAITGIEAGLEDIAGGPDLTLGLSYGRPATFNADTDFTAAVELSRLDEADYLLTQLSGEAGIIRYAREDLTYEAALGFITAREETDLGIRDYTLLTLPLNATLDRRNTPLDATSGWFADVELTPFVGVAGADSGARLYADARYYLSFGANDRVTLALRGQAGSVIGASLREAPRDFLFYSGGGSVRGQPFQSLSLSLTEDGPVGPVEVNLGGRSFLGLQAEARVGITESIGAVAFYDMGAIDAASFPDSESPWHAGAGIGVRYATAIGPIRLDVATPTTGDDAWNAVQVYIGIGQSF